MDSTYAYVYLTPPPHHFPLAPSPIHKYIHFQYTTVPDNRHQRTVELHQLSKVAPVIGIVAQPDLFRGGRGDLRRARAMNCCITLAFYLHTINIYIFFLDNGNLSL